MRIMDIGGWHEARGRFNRFARAANPFENADVLTAPGPENLPEKSFKHQFARKIIGCFGTRSPMPTSDENGHPCCNRETGTSFSSPGWSDPAPLSVSTLHAPPASL